MAATTHHTQVKLVRGNTTQVVWIPSTLGKVGKNIVLKDPDTGKWDAEAWKVEAAYSTVTTDYIMEHERDHLHQREASDI